MQPPFSPFTWGAQASKQPVAYHRPCLHAVTQLTQTLATKVCKKVTPRWHGRSVADPPPSLHCRGFNCMGMCTGNQTPTNSGYADPPLRHSMSGTLDSHLPPHATALICIVLSDSCCSLPLSLLLSCGCSPTAPLLLLLGLFSPPSTAASLNNTPLPCCCSTLLC